MQKVPSFLFGALVVVAAIFLVVRDASAGMDEFPLSLKPEHWTFSEGMEPKFDESVLALTASGSSAWATPGSHWPTSRGLEVSVKANARGGNLIVQVEWFDRAGTLVEPQEVLRMTGDKVQEQTEKIVPPEKAASFGLKFWIEGRPAAAELFTVTISREPDWTSVAMVVETAEPQSAKVEADEGLEIATDGGTWSLRLAKGKTFASAHINFPIQAKTGMRLLLPILQIPPQSSISIQVLGWSADRTFLGESKVLNDLTEAGDYEVVLPANLEGIPGFPENVTVKVWVTGSPGNSVQLGAIRFAEPTP